MKKIKIMKTVLLLCMVFALSSCEEDGAIQFIVVDTFPSNARVTGLQTSTSFNVNNTTDISDLLGNANTFVAAEVEKVTLTLNSDYSGTSITGSFNLNSGLVNVTENLTLRKDAGVELAIPEGASDILSIINAGIFSYNLTGNLNSATGDDDFTIKLEFKIRGTVE